MKILSDEHVPQAVITTLQSEGVDATSIYDTDLSAWTTSPYSNTPPNTTI